MRTLIASTGQCRLIHTRRHRSVKELYDRQWWRHTERADLCIKDEEFSRCEMEEVAVECNTE